MPDPTPALRLRGNLELTADDVSLEVDDFVPLRLRTSDRLLGVSKLLIRSESGAMVDLGVDPATRAVRGMTVVSVGDARPAPAPRIETRQAGLPVLAAALKPPGARLEAEVSVTIESGRFVILWSDCSSCRAMSHGPVDFLTDGDVLVGAAVSLEDDQATRLREHLAQATARRQSVV